MYPTKSIKTSLIKPIQLLEKYLGKSFYEVCVCHTCISNYFTFLSTDRNAIMYTFTVVNKKNVSVYLNACISPPSKHTHWSQRSIYNFNIYSWMEWENIINWNWHQRKSNNHHFFFFWQLNHFPKNELRSLVYWGTNFYQIQKLLS